MEEGIPILSICIPTYNRAEILGKTLEIITSDPNFDERVEIIVSDNCSNDSTGELVAKYCQRYANVKYFKTEEPIIPEENFYRALTLGSGKYLKLFNDYSYFAKGKLGDVVKIIEDKINSNDNLFFYQSTQFLAEGVFNCKGLNDFMNKSTYWCTWLSNFGIWKRDLKLLNDRQKFYGKSLDLMYWTLSLAAQKSSIIIFSNFYSAVIFSKIGSYNFYEVFVKNYLEILSYFVKIGNLTKKEFFRQKHILYKKHILYYSYVLYFKKNLKLKKKKGLQILLKHYWMHPYFYYEPIISFRKIFRT